MATAAARDLGQAARLFRALADETRLDIIMRLGGGEECVCNLTDQLETGQSRLSFHLKALKDAGIVRDRRAGRWVYYSLNPEMIEEIERLLGSLKKKARALPVVSQCCD
jgi:ArsR family transcriptional regulator